MKFQELTVIFSAQRASFAYLPAGARQKTKGPRTLDGGIPDGWRAGPAAASQAAALRSRKARRRVRRRAADGRYESCEPVSDACGRCPV